MPAHIIPNAVRTDPVSNDVDLIKYMFSDILIRRTSCKEKWGQFVPIYTIFETTFTHHVAIE